MGYPGDEGGGPPESRLDARTRRAALSSQSRAAQPWTIPPRGPAAPGEEEPEEAAGRPGTGHRLSRADRGQPSPARLWGQIRVRRGDQLPGRIQRQPPAPGRPLLLPGPDRRPRCGWIRGARPREARATRQPRPGDGPPASYARRRDYPPAHPGAPGTRQLPPARGYPARLPRHGTGQPSPARTTRRLHPGTGYPTSYPGDGATRQLHPGTGVPAGSSRGTGSGRAAGRRRREPAEGSRARAAPAPASAPATPSGGPPSRENAWRRPERRPGQEIQGAPGNGPAGGGSQPRGSLWSAGAFRTAGPGGRGPVRGFPPAPGAPDPVYPPGQFSPWNAPALRAVSAAGRPG